MAKFLDTTGVSYHIEQLIKNSKEKLVLVSPYIKVNPRIKELIEDKNRLKIDIRIIYGKQELQNDLEWFRKFDYVRTSYCSTLHAKCYMNESEALITSMNLYEFSQSNNNEMGILVTKSEDSRLYEEINQEVSRLIRLSKEIKVEIKKITQQEKVDIEAKRIGKEFGFCIRCKGKIKFDQKAPYCKECYTIWKEWANEDYVEKHCHMCGKPNKSSLKKPICLSCYKS